MDDIVLTGIQRFFEWLGDAILGWLTRSSTASMVNLLESLSDPATAAFEFSIMSAEYYNNWGLAVTIAGRVAVIAFILAIIAAAVNKDQSVRMAKLVIIPLKVLLLGIFAYPVFDLLVEGRDVFIGAAIDANVPQLARAAENQEMLGLMFGLNDIAGAAIVFLLSAPLRLFRDASQSGLNTLIATLTLAYAISVFGKPGQVLWKIFQALLWTFYMTPIILASTIGAAIATQIATPPLGNQFAFVDTIDTNIGVFAIFGSMLLCFLFFLMILLMDKGEMSPVSGRVTARLQGGSSQLGQRLRSVGQIAARGASNAIQSIGEAQRSKSAAHNAGIKTIDNSQPSANDLQASRGPSMVRPGTAFATGVKLARTNPLAGAAVMGTSVVTTGLRNAWRKLKSSD